MDRFVIKKKINLPPQPRILIVKKWALGDVLMATPILPQLKEHYPDAHISWLVDKRYAEILVGNPYLDDVISFDSVNWRKHFRYGNVFTYLKMSLAINRHLNRQKYDLVIALTPEKWWILWFLTAPYRIGLFPSDNLNWISRFYTAAIPRPNIKNLHSSTHYLMALQPIGIYCEQEKMSVGKTAYEEEYIERFKASHKINSNEPLVMIAPISTEENRTLSESMCASLCRWLSHTYQVRIILSATRESLDRLNQIKVDAGIDNIIVSCDTTMREYIALIRNSNFVVTADSSPVHVAAAIGTPYLALFGPIPAIERIPFGGVGATIDHPVDNAPCRTNGCNRSNCRQCVKQIDVEVVKEKIAAILTLPVR